MDNAAESRVENRLPDQRLVEAFHSLSHGDPTALDTIWDLSGARLHGLALWRTGSAEDAADVVQDVFVRIARKAAELHRVKDPQAWLMTVTHRIAIDHVRKRKVRSAEPLQDCHYLIDTKDDPAGIADSNRVSALLHRLPKEQREVIYLRLFAGNTFAEIGKIMSSSRYTAASRYRLAIDRMRDFLREGE